MAITYRPSAYDKNLQRWVAGDVEYEEHVGRVFSISSRDYRAMSDVYTIASYAMIVKDDGSMEEIMVNSGFEGDTKGGHAVVDVGPEAEALIAGYRARMAPIWEAALLVEAAIEEAKKRADDAEAYRIANKPVTGTKMIVVRGRKVKVGTIGVVAFISNNTGGVLLKDEKVWKDRKANGVWVEPGYLEVYNEKKHAAMLNKATDKVVKRLVKNAPKVLRANALGKDTTMPLIIKETWTETEYEPGWGVTARPDGTSYHLSAFDRKEFIKLVTSSNDSTLSSKPDSREGIPFDADDDLHAELVIAKNAGKFGIWKRLGEHHEDHRVYVEPRERLCRCPRRGSRERVHAQFAGRCPLHVVTPRV